MNVTLKSNLTKVFLHEYIHTLYLYEYHICIYHVVHKNAVGVI